MDPLDVKFYYLHYQVSILNYPLLTLFLDFGSHDHTIALVNETKVQGFRQLENHQDDSLLMPALEQLLKESSVTLKDLTHIAAVTGPGGFMSLRVGISLANALSWSLRIPLTGIHLSDLCFWRANSEQRTANRNGDNDRADRLSLIADRFVWLHSTKKNLLFLRSFGDLQKLWSEPVAISVDEARKQIPAGTAYVGELIEEHRTALPQLKPMQSIRPPADILPAFMQTVTFAMKPLEPWYGREG